MTLHEFDAIFPEVRELIQNNFRELYFREKDQSFTFGAHANKRVILKKDTAVELGGSTEGSCAFTLATSSNDHIEDGRVWLSGEDISNMPSDKVIPYGQIIFVSGSEISAEHIQAINDCQLVKDYIQGCLVRGVQGETWIRISRELFNDGFCFTSLAYAIRQLIRERVPQVEKVELVFMSASKQQLEQFYPLRDQWKEIWHSLKKSLWLEKGIDIDCPYGGGHCGKCDMKSTCDEVRKIQTIRKEKQVTYV